jgi:electron transport complex protein RnfB
MAVAVIDEDWCIGCTLCIKACPTDAIVGTHKRMHTVVERYCTGCDLCISVCPVDCIRMEVVSGERTGWAAWSSEQAATARERYRARQARLTLEAEAHQTRQIAKAEAKLADLPAHSKHTEPEVLDRKRALIEAALARARASRQIK